MSVQRKKSSPARLELLRDRSKPRSDFCGREVELNEICDVVSHLSDGVGRLFVLTGEPGIGKTRLASEVAHRAPTRVGVHWGRCWDGMDAPRLWVWIEVFRSLLRARSADELSTLIGDLADDAVSLMPELRASLPMAQPLPDLGPEGNQFRILEAGLEILRRCTVGAPALLLLDDLHAADSLSLRLLHFIARALPSLPVCIVATARDVEARMVPAVAEIMPSIVREGVRLPVRGLGSGDVSAMVEHRAGFEPTAGVVSTLEAATGGNPFLVDETVRLLLAERRLTAGQDLTGTTPLPEGAREVLHRRFELLSEDEQEALKCAAVIGRTFSPHLLACVCGVPDRRVLESLTKAASIGLVAKQGDGVASYEFVHDLVMAALLAEGEPHWRAETHLRIAEQLEEIHSQDIDPQVPEIARHYLRAVSAGGGERALHYTTRAARQAVEASREEEGARWAGRALRCLDQVGGTATQRAELMLQLGIAQRWTGRVDEGRKTLTEAGKLAQSEGDELLFARATVALAESRKETGLVDHEIIHTIERGLRALGNRSAPLRAHLLARLATALYFDERWAEGRAFSEEAVRLARPSGDPRVLGYALVARQLTLWRPEMLEERTALSAETLRFAEQSAHLPTIFEARNWHMVNLLEAGHMAAVDSEIDELERRFEKMRYARALGYVRLFRTMRELMSGRFDASEAAITAILEEANRQPNEDGLLQYAGSQLYFLHLERGRVGDLEGTVRYLADQFPVLKTWRAGLAQILLETGRRDEAHRELLALAPWDFDCVRRDGNWMTVIAVLAEVCVGLGDRERAGVLYELLLPYRDRNVIVALGTQCYGSVSRYLGMLAGTLGRWDEAIAHLEYALEKDEGVGAVPFVAWDHHWLSIALRGKGEIERARAAERSALQTAEALGMSRLVARIETAEPVRAPLESAHSGVTELHLCFRRVGDVWQIGSPASPVSMRHTRGLAHLHRLLSSPKEELAASSLHADGEVPERSGRGDPLLDDKTRSELRERLRELRAERDEAEANADVGQVERINEELGKLEEFVRKATGLGGRDRGHASSAERARVNVTRTIRSALERIRKADPLVAEVLSRSIQTGRFCSYEPDESRPVVWAL